MTTDFTHLDELLFEAIEQQPMDFTTLQSRFEAEFDKHAKADRYGGPNGWRLIDRRLQALRKAGRIEFVKKQWHAAGKGRLL